MEDAAKACDTLGRLHEACLELEADIHANVCDRERFKMALKSTFITKRLMVWRLPFPSTLYVSS
jgi:hypothetical protein